MWVDTTKRSWNQTEKDIPTINLEFKKATILISLTSKHIYNPGFWVLHCSQLNISEKQIAIIDTPIEEVKEKALWFITNRLTDMLSAIRDETI